MKSGQLDVMQNHLQGGYVSHRFAQYKKMECYKYNDLLQLVIWKQLQYNCNHN